MQPRESLGPVAAILLPIEKLKRPSPRGIPFEREVHAFLSANSSGYTVASGNIAGHWRDRTGADHYGEHREYKVAASSSGSNFRSLEEFLATLARDMDESCIYVEWGGDALLIYAAAP